MSIEKHGRELSEEHETEVRRQKIEGLKLGIRILESKGGRKAAIKFLQKRLMELECQL